MRCVGCRRRLRTLLRYVTLRRRLACLAESCRLALNTRSSRRSDFPATYDSPEDDTRLPGVPVVDAKEPSLGRRVETEPAALRVGGGPEVTYTYRVEPPFLGTASRDPRHRLAE